MTFLEALLDHASALGAKYPNDQIQMSRREDEASYFSAIQNYLDKTEKAKDAAANFIAALAPQAPVGAAAPMIQPGAALEPRNPDKLLAPEPLAHGTTGEKLDDWIEAFTTFLQSGRHLSIKRQHGYFNQVIDVNVKSALRGLYEPGITPILEPGGVLDILRSQSLVQYPIFNRRQDFFEMKRSEGENPLEYLYKLDAFASEANIAAMTPDDITLQIFMASCNDKKLRDKIRSEKRQDLTHIKQFVRQYVQNENTEDAIKESTRVVAAMAPATARNTRQGGRGQSGGGRRTQRPTRNPGMQGRCWRCGKQKHNVPERECIVLLNNLTCNFCGIWGHLSSVCQKRGNEEQTKPVNVISEDFSDLVTPHFNVNVKHKNGDVTMKCLADTGASTTLIKSDVAAAHNIEIQPSIGSCFQTVTGEPIPIDGQAHITLSTPSKSIKTSAIVTPTSSEDLLIGYNDLKCLGIIPRSFPVHGCKKIAFKAIKKSLTKLFPDVLTDILPDSAKTGPLMKIHLKPGEKTPFRITTARAIPLHWVEKAERCVNKLLNAKTIARQDLPTEWCAPGFFVLKQDGELRLVVDYTGLNKHIERPTHVFPSTAEIIAGIDPKSRYFAKLDALSGYHQVPLDEESAKLTTFLLPSGRFKHLVAPMGLSASSDEFCRRSDDIVANLPGVWKLVDDILISAPTIDILTDRITGSIGTLS